MKVTIESLRDQYGAEKVAKAIDELWKKHTEKDLNAMAKKVETGASNNNKVDKLCEAISEAERFIQKAEFAILRLSTDDIATITGCKEMAAAKRASMDLTRALVELRR